MSKNVKICPKTPVAGWLTQRLGWPSGSWGLGGFLALSPPGVLAGRGLLFAGFPGGFLRLSPALGRAAGFLGPTRVPPVNFRLGFQAGVRVGSRSLAWVRFLSPRRFWGVLFSVQALPLLRFALGVLGLGSGVCVLSRFLGASCF